MSSPHAKSRREDAESHASPWRVHTLAPSPVPRHDERLSPPRVIYSGAWVGLGALAGLLGLAALRRWPRTTLGGAMSLGALALGHIALGEPPRPRLERITLRLPQLPAALDGLRIGQISDIHLGLRFTERNLRWAVAQMGHERPDLLALTGDLAGLAEGIPDLAHLLRGLHAPLGVYAVPGNHDYWEGLDDLKGALGLLGIPLLLNQHRRLSWRGSDLWLVGLDDLWDGRPRLAEALAGVPRDGFTLLLAHAPDVAPQAARLGVDVQLSGHTHGGHFRLPLLGPFARPRYGVRYVIGRYQLGQLAVYVSRGLGGPPLRLFCPPEAAILTLRRAV